MTRMAPSGTSLFRRIVWAYYRTHGRHDLPWRKTKDPYKILVSEIMLQQTQVGRVIPFYRKFIKRFPTARRLAEAPLSAVLKSWQGLGYNRRAKQLKAAAQALMVKKIRTVSELEALPGVGPYTARAVAAFAWNKDVTVIETNIRTVVIHHFFNPARKRKGMIYHTSTRKVSDKEIEGVLARTFPKGKSRKWYSALMDYGAHLKRSGISYNAKSRGYTKQAKFAGSLREARGAILRAFVKQEPLAQLRKRFPRHYTRALAALRKEGMITSQSIRG